jgi:hypothetical protein
MRKPDLAEGDLVRFLNDKLEGRILHILPGDKAVVEIEDGFPVETVISELVRIKSAVSESSPPKASETLSKPLLDIPAFPLEPGIHLLLVPYPGQVHSGPWQVQLLNTLQSPILFSLFFDNPLLKSITEVCGTLLPGKMQVLGDAMAGSEHTAACEIELIIHDRSLAESKRYQRLRCSPSAPGIQCNFPSLSSPYSFTTALCIYRTSQADDQPILDKEQAQRIKEAMSGSGRTSPSASFSASPTSKNIELIVDLHIESIGNNWKPKDEKQLLEFQLRHFKKELDRAILESFRFVFFIHGVGNGILRKALRTELDSLGFRYTDGPSGRFGQGATKVSL